MSDKLRNTIILGIFLLSLLSARSAAQNAPPHPDSSGETPYQDLSHDSKVFGGKRTYRLYLPAGYASSSRRYPVIYFFHGWGGRYFKDDNAKLEYARLKELVDLYHCILVMWDGCMDGKEPDPYNIGNHEDVKFQVQMKDYFPELVAYIDATYKTLADRSHRGIIGFSMGGFMSLFLAGKYPDMVCADVSLAGSAELYVGYPDIQTLYSVRYTFANLSDIDLRIHNGNTDILYYLNEEVHAGAVWEGKNLEYWTFPGGHMIDSPGEIRVFGKAMFFLTEAFKKAPAPAQTWSHYDIYSDFSIWGYRIVSDKKEPGFLFLKNVSKKGFGWYTRRWLPDGPSLDSVQATLTTGPVYTAGKTYTIVQYKAGTFAGNNDRNTSEAAFISLKRTAGDATGRLHFNLEGSGVQLGISADSDSPDYVFLDHTVGTPPSSHPNVGSFTKTFLPSGQASVLNLRVLNRGGEIVQPRAIRVRLRSADTSVQITDAIQSLQVKGGDRILHLPPFHLSCRKTAPPHAEPASIKFYLTISDGPDSSIDDFIVPVWFKVPEFDSIRVDDGRVLRDSAWGSGNGDGIVQAGERVLLYQGSHRLRLYTEDPWVLKDQERLADEMIPARWPDGVTLSSVIRIAPGCPDGHIIECLGSYETKAFNPIERKLTWGKLQLIVHRTLQVPTKRRS